MAKQKKSDSTNIKPLIVIVLIIIALFILFNIFSGGNGGGEKKPPLAKSDYTNVSVVFGNHENSPEAKIPNDLMEVIENTVLANKLETINIINATTTPDIQPINIIKKEEYDGSDIDKIIKDVKNALETIHNASGLKPKADGADYLNAIKNAADYMNKADNNASKQNLIIVVGSGLSDSGILNFADGNLLDKDTDEVMNVVDNKLGGSELENTKIIWLNCGETYAPQFPLSPELKNKEQNIYQKVLTKLGVKSVDFQTKVTKSGSVETNGKTVKVTDIPNDEIDWGSFQMQFDDSILGGFITNTANFKDVTKADSALKSLAKLLNDHPKVKVNIEGSQMKEVGKPKVDYGDVAQMRADGVKARLVSLGISADRIYTSNIGSRDAIKDADENDKKVTIAAKK